MRFEEFIIMVDEVAGDVHRDFNYWLNWAHTLTNRGDMDLELSLAGIIRLVFLAGVEQGVRFPANYDCTLR